MADSVKSPYCWCSPYNHHAGSTATVLCYPLDVIRTRMLSGNKKYASAGATIRHMLGEESVAGFYVGCLPAVLSTAASGAIFYGVYDILKTRYVSSEQRKLQASKGVSDEVIMGAGRTMLYGALAGAAAESILYPLEVLRRRCVLPKVLFTLCTSILTRKHFAPFRYSPWNLHSPQNPHSPLP